MVRLGMNVVVIRDLTDTMYNSKQWPEFDQDVLGGNYQGHYG
jgi:hypothetical protein